MKELDFIGSWNKSPLATRINVLKGLGYDWPYPYIQDFVVNRIFQDIEYNFRLGMLDRMRKKKDIELYF